MTQVMRCGGSRRIRATDETGDLEEPRDASCSEHRMDRRERCQFSEQSRFDDVAAVQHGIGVAQGGVHGIGETARATVLARGVAEVGVGEDDRAHVVSEAGHVRK